MLICHKLLRLSSLVFYQKSLTEWEKVLCLESYLVPGDKKWKKEIMPHFFGILLQ